MAVPVGHLTIKFNSIKFNSLGLLIIWVWSNEKTYYILSTINSKEVDFAIQLSRGT